MSIVDSKFDDVAPAALAERLRQHKDASGESWKSLAAKIGLGDSTLSAFAAGKYLGDNQAIATELSKWFRTEETQELFGNSFLAPPFQMTTTAKNIHAVLTFAKLSNMAIITGEPGMGKTSALKRFAEQNANVWRVTASPSRSGYNAFFAALLQAMNAPHSGPAGFYLSERVRRLMNQRNAPLIVIDEAQFVGENVIEEVRAIHDDTGCGVVFCGNRQVPGRIDGNHTAQYAQRSSRIGKRLDLTVPTGQDVSIILGAWDVIDQIEIDFLTRIAMLPGAGAIRQMSKVLEQATLMANAMREKRSILHLKDAADDLNAGMVA
jgi:DNA transposition AAA+ family ATPase